jgi:hypothetical protein
LFDGNKIQGIGFGSGRNSKSHSRVVQGRSQACGHRPHVSNIPVRGKSRSELDREAKAIGSLIAAIALLHAGRQVNYTDRLKCLVKGLARHPVTLISLTRLSSVK